MALFQVLILVAVSTQAIVIATPYKLAFDYDAMAEAAAARFERTVRHQLHAFTGVAAALVPCTIVLFETCRPSPESATIACESNYSGVPGLHGPSSCSSERLSFLLLSRHVTENSV